MAWLRMDDRVRTHPKLVAAGPAAAWFWFCGICYSREHLTDGFIPTGIIATLAPGVSSGKKLASKLVDCGLWHIAEGGFTVHDFLDWNPSRSDVEAARQKDSARKKNGILTESERTPKGIQTTPRARTHDAGLGLVIGSGSVSSEGGSGETAPLDALWSHWRTEHQRHSGVILRIGTTHHEVTKLAEACSMVPDAAKRERLVTEFLTLDEAECAKLNVKAKTLGYFVMAIPALLERGQSDEDAVMARFLAGGR